MIKRIQFPRSKNGGSGVQPTTQDWIDLSTAGGLTLAPDASLGFHDYSYNIGVGAKGDLTVFTQDADGLIQSVRAAGGSQTTALIHVGACSLRYDPLFEFIFYCPGPLASYVIMLGVVSEAITDNTLWDSKDYAHRIVWHQKNAQYVYVRGLAGATLSSTGHPQGWIRMTMEPEDGGLIEYHLLPSGNPSDWDDTSSPIASYRHNFGQNLIGGNVMTPILSLEGSPTYVTHLRATRTTMRRP